MLCPFQDGRDLLELIDTQDAEIQELWKAINKKRRTNRQPDSGFRETCK